METRSQHNMFIALMLGAFALTVLIFLPFLTAIVIAIVIAVIARPLHRWVAKMVSKGNERSTLAATISLIIIAVVIITPLALLTFRLYTETQNLYFTLTEEAFRTKIVNSLNFLLYRTTSIFFDITPTFTFDSFNVTSYIQNIFKWSFSNLETVFSSAARIGMNLFIALLALYYALRDGTMLRKQLISFSPLLDTHEEQILNKLDQAIHSVVTGSLIIGVLQGILTGIGFWFFGIPNPVLWGSVAMIAALIPGIGTSLILVPGIAYLYITSTQFHALGLLIWGILAVGLIDNVLSGHLMNRRVQIHPFLILLSVLGGLTFFGPVGFVLGPIVLAFLFAMIEIYKKGHQKVS